jgi:hypothetical protein
MKSNRLLIVTLLLFELATLSLEPSGQGENTELSINPEMSFMVSVEKANYFPWESVTVKARLENKTNTSLITLLPDMLMDSTVIVESANEKREFNNLTVYRSQLARQPATLKSGETYEQEFTLECSLDELFPRSGTYAIRLVLNNLDEKRRLISNTVDITIDNVTDIDKEALDFINRNKVHRYYPMLFSWNLEAKTKDGRTLLEGFVSRYSRSVYGDYAILQLSRYYFIAKDAKSTLSDVEKYCPGNLPKQPE